MGGEISFAPQSGGHEPWQSSSHVDVFLGVSLERQSGTRRAPSWLVARRPLPSSAFGFPPSFKHAPHRHSKSTTRQRRWRPLSNRPDPSLSLSLSLYLRLYSFFLMPTLSQTTRVSHFGIALPVLRLQSARELPGHTGTAPNINEHAVLFSRTFAQSVCALRSGRSASPTHQK